MVASVCVSPFTSHALLCLHRLVQSVAPATARHLAARELVDDNDLSVLAHDVLLILVEEARTP